MRTHPLDWDKKMTSKPAAKKETAEEVAPVEVREEV